MPEGSTPTQRSRFEHEVLHALLETLERGNVGLSIVALDVDPPEYVFISSAGPALLGYTVEEFVKIPAWDLFPEEELPRLRARHIERMKDPTGTHHIEMYVKHRDGTKIPLEVTTSRITFAGRPANVSFTHDASSKIAALRALEASETRFRQLVESAPDGVVILRDTTLSYVNSAAAAMLGFDRPEEAIGRHIDELLAPADAVRAASRLSELQRTGQRSAESSEYRSRRRDGREIVVEISSMPIEFEGAPATLAFARDITERKAMHEKMVQADRLAAVGTLAAGIAHEINNPLAYVLLGLQYLERELPKVANAPHRIAEMLARLGEIRSGAERVGGIVSGLKMFARADEAERGPVDLQAVIEAAIKISDNEIRHRSRLIRTYETNALVDGNAARLEQVFLNLLVNAAHAVSDREPAQAEIRVRLRLASAGRVVAEVSDNGMGIEAGILPRIFDPFFTTKPIGIGTGLGLPICKSIVEGFGGTIGVESSVGHGTTIRIDLPVFPDDPGALAEGVHETESSFPPPDRGRVLVVDDEPLVAALLSRMLATEHEVSVATSATEALSLLEENLFDAIVCDVMMPGMTGMDLYTVIKEKSPGLAGRMVFVTGGAFVPRVAEFLTSIENPKLDKPLDLKALLKAIRDIRTRTVL
ncbi:MAG TPA: PAS domain S-box protein [Polyangiaceae bacterium]|jgi:PAS domain S-box-containing protein|nr:PAS domain S-box protein [Polyangiaceae bacterium]